MNTIEIDRIALWKQTGISGLTTRVHSAGTKVVERGSSVLTPSTAKVFRFAKDYKTEAGLFSLFVRTYSEDSAEVESALDSVAQSITEEQVLELMSRIILEPYYFEYLDNYLERGQS